jgi:hypothetical protein
MSSRLLQVLIAFALIFIVLSLPTPAKACCGETPNYFFTISVVRGPDCSVGFNTGSITWKASYHLPSNHKLFVDSYGDGVVQDTDFYEDLPHQVGSTTDYYTVSDTWQWQVGASGTRKVRIQFDVHQNITGWQDQALIVFDCTSRGVANLAVYNFPDTYTTP